MLEKCVLTILESSWNQHLGHKKTKLNICHHALTSSTQLQNWSFHVVERTRTSTKCKKMKNARAKRAKILFFIVKYANLWSFCCRRRRGCLSSLILVISRRRKNENVYKMSNIEKCTCKACTNTVFHCQICKFVGFLLPSSSWLLKLPINLTSAERN